MKTPEMAGRASIAAARRKVAAELRAAGIESAQIDARLLIGHALGLDHTGLVANAERGLSEAESARIAKLVARRVAHEPVARILGEKEFWGMPLVVSAATLVPRPETETIVEAALAVLANDNARGKPLRIADLGTGTGAILLALLKELPAANGVGADINPDALVTARENARRLGIQERCSFVQSDFGAALSGRFDLVVSNPPYIASGDIETLPAEVRDFDPALALDGGTDGLACYRRIAREAGALLNSGGLLVLEVGAGQAEAVLALMRAGGLRPEGAPRTDLAGIPRALVFRGFS
jgi:release factor glutamine methyltransferase